MIISPQGKIVAEATEADGLAIADIEPYGGREGGDAFNTQRDMRGRLFRERVPEAYSILTDPNPPVLTKVPSNLTKEDAIRIMATVLTTGEERFNHAESLARAGKTREAIRLFEQLSPVLRGEVLVVQHIGEAVAGNCKQVMQPIPTQEPGMAHEIHRHRLRTRLVPAMFGGRRVTGFAEPNTG